MKNDKYLGLTPTEFFEKVKNILLAKTEEQKNGFMSELQVFVPYPADDDAPETTAIESVMSWIIGGLLGISIDEKTYEIKPNTFNYYEALGCIIYELFGKDEHIWKPIAVELGKIYVIELRNNPLKADFDQTKNEGYQYIMS